MMTRKDFLKRTGLVFLGAGLSSVFFDILSKSSASAVAQDTLLHEAMFYKVIDESTVQCELCSRRCTLSEGQRSFCRVREPRGGKLYTFAYGEVCAAHIDPIEKKPLFHFLPGTQVFSVATAGCNYRCKYCQNWEISQVRPEDVRNEKMSPQDIVNHAVKYKCPTVAYTYTEPAIFYEYMLDTARLTKSHGVRSMYHSNGSLSERAAEELSLYLDAADIDLKGFDQNFYTEVTAGYLDTVLNTLKILKDNNVWLEITNLIVPTMNDEIGKIKKMCVWIKDNLGPDVPLHFSRFHPQYKLTNLYPTPVETLEEARYVALQAGLRYVYIGNVPGHPAEHTYCPGCKKPVIRRSGYTILTNDVAGGKCRFCGSSIAGVWS